MKELFLKECKMVGKSLVYFVLIAVIFAFYDTQFYQSMPLRNTNKFHVHRKPLQEPVYVEDYEAYRLQYHVYPYGTVYEDLPELIMPGATERLFYEYIEGRYQTYPIGFVKYVKLKEKETKRIEEILKEITGKSIENLKEMSYKGEWKEIKANITVNYDRFKELMEEVSDIIGHGSSYSKENLEKLGSRPKTYEEALKEYKVLIDEDKITNGYARLFSDYLGIVLALFPAFVVVFYMLRDKKSNMHQLIYYREISSFKLIVSRFMALVFMIMLPVLLLGIFSTIKFIGIGRDLNAAIDYFAFIKYSLGWLMPTVMAVTALGMFLTILTDSVVTVLVQIVWFFITLFSGGLGGNYGITQLIIRFNTERARDVFVANINAILINRIFYLALSAVLLAASVYILNKKRLGRIDIYGKLRKQSSDIQGEFKSSFS